MKIPFLPSKGTKLKLSPPLRKLKRQGLINAQEAQDIKAFKRQLKQDGHKGGVLDVKIKSHPQFSEYDPPDRLSLDFQLKPPVKDRKMQGHHILNRTKDTLKSILEGEYAWYKTIAKQSIIPPKDNFIS